MKSILLAVLGLTVVLRTATAAPVEKLEYAVVGVKCVGAAQGKCPDEFKSFTFTADPAKATIQFERQKKPMGSEVWFMESKVDGNDHAALTYDDQLKRLHYFRTSEIWDNRVDYVIDTVNVDVQFYQLDPERAVLIETYTQISTTGFETTVTTSYDLKRKTKK